MNEERLHQNFYNISDETCRNSIYCLEIDSMIINRGRRHQCLSCDVATMGGQWGGLVDRGVWPAHWIYVLKSNACGGWYYVGVTKNLKRRLRQHLFGTGAQCTKRWKFRTLVALYKCPFNDRGRLEQIITHRWMAAMPNQEWWRVRGGAHCSILEERNSQTKPPLTFLRKIKNHYHRIQPTNLDDNCRGISHDPYLFTQCSCGFPCALSSDGFEKSFLVCPSAKWFNTTSNKIYLSDHSCDFRMEIMTPLAQRKMEELDFERQLATLEIPAEYLDRMEELDFERQLATLEIPAEYLDRTEELDFERQLATLEIPVCLSLEKESDDGGQECLLLTS